MQILQPLNTKITATKRTTIDSVFLKTKMDLDQEDIHLVVEDKETMLSLLIVHSANCVKNMVTPFTSAITDLILIFKAIHLQIVLLYIIHLVATTKCKLWLHLQLWKIVRHGSLTLGPLIIWLKILRLSDVKAYKGNEQVIVGNGKKLPILHTGSKLFLFTFKKFHLKKVYHVSRLTTNLISVSKFYSDNNVFFEFHPKFFLVKDPVSRKVLLQGQLKNGLHEFPHLTDDVLTVFYTLTMSNTTSSLWHSKLCHPANDILTKALNSCNIAYQRNKHDVCFACPVAKSHKLPFS